MWRHRIICYMAIENPSDNDDRFPPPYGYGSEFGDFQLPPVTGPLDDVSRPNYEARHYLPGEETQQLFLPPGALPPPHDRLGAHAYERHRTPFGVRRFVGLEPMFSDNPPIDYIAATSVRFQEAVSGTSGVMERYKLFQDMEYDELPRLDDTAQRPVTMPVYLEHESEYGLAQMRLTHDRLNIQFNAVDGEETGARYASVGPHGMLCREVPAAGGKHVLLPISTDEAAYIIDVIKEAKPVTMPYDALAGIICQEAVKRDPLSSGEAWQANRLLQQVTGTYRTAVMSVEDIMAAKSEVRRVMQAENGDLTTIVTDVVQVKTAPKNADTPEYYIAVNRTTHSRNHDLTPALAARNHELPADRRAGAMTLYDTIWIYPSTAGPECVLNTKLVEDGSEINLSERMYRLNAPMNIIRVLRNHVLSGKVLDGVML